jgi:hypothetical protein
MNEANNLKRLRDSIWQEAFQTSSMLHGLTILEKIVKVIHGMGTGEIQTQHGEKLE